MKRTWLALTLAGALLAAPAPAQSLMEAAAVAAGATVGIMAGKIVSEGIDALFGRGNSLVKSAAAPNTKPASKRHQLVLPFPLKKDARGPSKFEPISAAKTAEARAGADAPGTVQEFPVVAEAAPAEQTDTTASPPPFEDRMRSVTPGEERDTVLARLGQPSARIFIPEGGGQEILQYRVEGRLAASVRLSAGVVTGVNAMP